MIYQNVPASIPHQPIMVAEILDGLQVEQKPNATYIDGTLGAGGHSHAILQARPDNRILGFDLDPAALAIAQKRLSSFGERATVVHASYTEMAHLLKETLQVSAVDGILLDLGVSSMQFDQSERGFAFRLEGPLDMRFDPSSPTSSAADLVNTLSADELADILFQYGEERQSRRIAKAIVQARPISNTNQLATLIASVIHSNEKIHPATRSFQALRIAVNQELEAVETVLPMALNCLKTGGRLAIITFHSLEDRLVKQFFKQESSDCLCPPRQPFCTCGHHASLKLITRKPLVANEAEVASNPRARSAKLRIVERL